MQKITLNTFLNNLDPLIKQWLESQEFLGEYQNKMPFPFRHTNALHHLYFIIYTEYHWTAHNTEYCPLERKIMENLMEQAIITDPELALFKNREIPNILMQS